MRNQNNSYRLKIGFDCRQGYRGVKIGKEKHLFFKIRKIGFYVNESYSFTAARMFELTLFACSYSHGLPFLPLVNEALLGIIKK